MLEVTSKLKFRTIQGHRPGIWIWFARLHLGEVCESGLEYVLHIGRVDGVSVGAIGHRDFEGFESFLEIRKDPVMHHVKFRNDSSVAPRSDHSLGSIRCHCCRLYIHIHIHMTMLLTKTTTNAPFMGVSIISFTAVLIAVIHQEFCDMEQS